MDKRLILNRFPSPKKLWGDFSYYELYKDRCCENKEIPTNWKEIAPEIRKFYDAAGDQYVDIMESDYHEEDSDIVGDAFEYWEGSIDNVLKKAKKEWEQDLIDQEGYEIICLTDTRVMKISPDKFAKFIIENKRLPYTEELRKNKIAFAIGDRKNY